jgi:hypothetical protein
MSAPRVGFNLAQVARALTGVVAAPPGADDDGRQPQQLQEAEQEAGAPVQRRAGIPTSAARPQSSAGDGSPSFPASPTAPSPSTIVQARRLRLRLMTGRSRATVQRRRKAAKAAVSAVSELAQAANRGAPKEGEVRAQGVEETDEEGGTTSDEDGDGEANRHTMAESVEHSLLEGQPVHIPKMYAAPGCYDGDNPTRLELGASSRPTHRCVVLPLPLPLPPLEEPSAGSQRGRIIWRGCLTGMPGTKGRVLGEDDTVLQDALLHQCEEALEVPPPQRTLHQLQRLIAVASALELKFAGDVPDFVSLECWRFMKLGAQ